MAGWSILANGSGLDSVENVGTNENKGVVIVGVNPDVDGIDLKTDDESDARLRGLFDEVLSRFVKAIGEKGKFRPLPPILDCEKNPVDLFRLFSIVRGKGGYGLVSKRRLWGFVSKELGFRVRASASVKLVYFKYLNDLEKCLVDKKNFGGLEGNFRVSFSELETKFRGLLPGAVLAPLDDGENIGDSTKDHGGSASLVSLDMDVGVEKGKDCKRKRECLSEMLKWLKESAKLSSVWSFGTVGELSKLEKNSGKELFAEAIRAREMLFLKRHVGSHNEESISQKKLKMHPSMYEDRYTRSHQSSEGLRCSQRVLNVAKSRSCTCCNTCLHTPHKLANPHDLDPDNECKEEPPAAGVESNSVLPTEACPLEDEPAEKHVLVGPRFQAEVPEWTGVAYESEAKWLGTRVWPLECREHKSSANELDTSLGKGRRGFCRCPFPGSGECVRFHIAEARMKLKLELGPVFFSWKFHRMGEEVSLQWTPEEENRFRDVIRSNKSFGDRKIWWFLRKSKESLVSYYFNVFLVQKRSYQNRVTPKDIDSDDDETEFGSIGGHYGNSSVDLSGSNFVSCIQNRQCADLEETKCSSEIKPMQC